MIVIEIDTVRAPITGGNFLEYVDNAVAEGGRDCAHNAAVVNGARLDKYPFH